jgi:hypothetical protein
VIRLRFIVVGSSTVRTTRRRAPPTGICDAGSSPKGAEEQEQGSKFERSWSQASAGTARTYRPPQFISKKYSDCRMARITYIACFHNSQVNTADVSELSNGIYMKEARVILPNAEQ